MKKFLYASLLVIWIMACHSCTNDDFIRSDEIVRGKEHVHDPVKETRHVLLLYFSGFNSLHDDMMEDIGELEEGFIPGIKGSDNVLLLYTHNASSGYNTPKNSYLIRFFTEDGETVLRDTLKTFPDDMISNSSDTVRDILTYVKDQFPAKSYGLVFSSHGSGWMPAGYYSPSSGTTVIPTAVAAPETFGEEMYSTPYNHPEGDRPLVKSLGEERTGSNYHYTVYEMQIHNLAAKIPMPLEYIILDACLMGGVEVAYEFKDVCKVIGLSPAEVLASGFNYKDMASFLLKGPEPDPVGVCKDYFNFYNQQTGVRKSATICAVNCMKMGHLADVCNRIYDNHKDGLRNIRPSEVQGFFRYNKHWFYDLRDIIVKAGASVEELRDFDNAMSECILYKDATKDFLIGESGFHINTFCGLSSYLPCNGSGSLNMYYRTLKWNEDTMMVR